MRHEGTRTDFDTRCDFVSEALIGLVEAGVLSEDDANAMFRILLPPSQPRVMSE